MVSSTLCPAVHILGSQNVAVFFFYLRVTLKQIEKGSSFPEAHDFRLSCTLRRGKYNYIVRIKQCGSEYPSIIAPSARKQ